MTGSRIFKSVIVIVMTMLAILPLSAQGLEQDSIRNQSVGLVLSGGGARGIAHIGVIQALEDNDIPIDYITGTSMGAIVGGLYAAGYSPAEMMELLESPGFANWSTGQIDRKLTYYFSQPEPTPAFVNLNIGENDSSRTSLKLPTSLINPLPMNFAFMDIFAAYTAQCGGDFNKLFVPFRCVASDVDAKHKVVFSSGSLGDAVRASMSFPLVFYPLEENGVLLYDGGIYDNFPVNVMRGDFAPGIMIGVDVSTNTPNANISRDPITQLENMIMQNSDYRLPAREGIKIHIDLNNFSLLDFPKAKEIYQIGYDRGVAMIDSIKARVTSRISKDSRTLRRRVFKSHTPYIRFDKVNVKGGTRSQNEFIRYIFTHNRPDTFGIARARQSFYRAISPGKLQDLMPHAIYNDSTGLFTLDLKAEMKDKFNVGFGAYLSSSTSSMLFFSGSYKTFSFNSLDANVSGWIGQSYNAARLTARISMYTATPTSLGIEGVVSRHKFYESDKLFFEDRLPSFLTSSEYFARFNFTMAAGNSGKMLLGLGYGHLDDRYYVNVRHTDVIDRRHIFSNLGQALARYEYNTLDNQLAPTTGADYRVSAMGVTGGCSNGATERRTWGQIEASARNYFGVSKSFSMGTAVTVLASTRKLFPTYIESVIQAPVFNPTPSSYNTFDPAFRANSFTTVTLMPVFKFSSVVQLRGNFSLFMPLRPIVEVADGSARYGRAFGSLKSVSELSGVISLPFGTIDAYASYATSDAGRWTFGISLGVFILAPRFLR